MFMFGKDEKFYPQKGCDDPVDTTLLKNLVIPCTGACLVYRLPVSNSKKF